MDSNPNLPATTEPAAGPPAMAPDKKQALDLWGDSVEQYWTSLRAETPGERMRLYNALDGDSDGFAKALGQELVIQHVVLAPRELTDTKTGEVIEAVRIAVITDKGDVFAGFSGGIKRSLGRLGRSYGLPPWLPGLKVKVAQVELKDGHRMYRLDLIEELLAAAPPNGAAVKPAKK